MPSGHFVGYFRYGTDLLWNSIRLYKTPHTQMNSIVRTHGLRGLPECKTIECPMCKASCKVMRGQASSLLKNYSLFD